MPKDFIPNWFFSIRSKVISYAIENYNKVISYRPTIHSNSVELTKTFIVHSVLTAALSLASMTVIK